VPSDAKEVIPSPESEKLLPEQAPFVPEVESPPSEIPPLESDESVDQMALVESIHKSEPNLPIIGPSSPLVVEPVTALRPHTVPLGPIEPPLEGSIPLAGIEIEALPEIVEPPLAVGVNTYETQPDIGEALLLPEVPLISQAPYTQQQEGITEVGAVLKHLGAMAGILFRKESS
jgi:hypothetical protein